MVRAPRESGGGGCGISILGDFNLVAGIRIGTDDTGNDLGNELDGIQLAAASNAIGPGNVIGLNGRYDILAGGSDVIVGNFIGTDGTGAMLGNGEDGIRVEAFNNLHRLRRPRSHSQRPRRKRRRRQLSPEPSRGGAGRLR